MKYGRDAAENKVLGPPLVLVPGGIAGKLKSIPVVDNGEVAAIAGVVAGVIGGDDDDNDEDDDNDNDGDEDDDDEDERKPSGGGIRLVPRAERRRGHRGMASVTTIISGGRKRKATDDSV